MQFLFFKFSSYYFTHLISTKPDRHTLRRLGHLLIIVGTRFSIGLQMQPGKRAGQLGTRFSIGLQMQPGKRAGQLASCPARFPGCICSASCPARFPGCICSPMEKRVPTKIIWEAVGSWFPALRVRFFARALRTLAYGSGLTWLWRLTMCA